MSKTPRLFSLTNLERVVFRPLFVFFTFALVLLAIFQASGRFTMEVLSLFEREVNAVLSTQNISVRGLQGSWRGLNPLVKVDSLSFPAGNVSALEVELDLLESMFRSELVLAVARVDSVDVHLEQSGKSWRLRGMPVGGNRFDATALLQHSDDLSGLVRVHLHQRGDADADILRGEIALFNRTGLHHVHARLSTLTQPDSVLVVKVWQRDNIPFVQSKAHAAEIAGQLLVPQALTGMSNLIVSVDRANWFDIEGMGEGEIELALDGVSLPNNNVDFQVQFGLQAQRTQERIEAVSQPLRVQAAQDSLQVPPFYLTAYLPEEDESTIEAAADLLVDNPEHPMLSVWSKQLALGDVGAFFAQHLTGIEAAHNWLNALEVQGTAHNVHVFADPEMGFGYQASITGLNMQGYHGAPTLKNLEARLWGYENGIALQANGRNSHMQFPDLYHEGWDFSTVQGVVKAWFGSGYFGMQGSHIKAQLDGTNVAGAFSITRPAPKYEQRLSLLISTDQVGLLRAKSFVPFKIPEALAQWLERGPRAGTMLNSIFAYHGQIHIHPGELARRIELLTDVADVEVEYDPRWPLVAGIAGQVHVAGVETRIRADQGLTGAVKLHSAEVVLHNNTTYATGALDASGDAAAILTFVRTSPLIETMNFITPQWQGGGEMRLKGDLVIPIRAEVSPALAVDLDFQVADMMLAMPDYRIVVQALNGSGSFSLPHHLDGQFEGELFSQPAQLSARFDKQWLHFDIAGRATPQDVYTLLETDTAVPIEGDFLFDSVLSLAMDGGVTNLAMTTDLQGLEVNLPGQFGKSAAASIPSELNVQFLADYQSVRWRYQNVDGWLHYGDGIERGALGIATSPPMTAQDERAIVISGHMPRLVLSDWVSNSGESAVALPLDWVIQGLMVDEFVIDELSFSDLKIEGAQRGEDVHFVTSSEHVKGRVSLPAQGLLDLDLDYLQIPDDSADIDEHIGAPSEDPISVEVGRSLPAASVKIAQLDIGNEPFGAWQFTIEPSEHEIVFAPFVADVNGVHIQDSLVTWDLQSDRTNFSGRIRLDDLSETLPKWDYAPSLSTTKSSVKAEINWSGSPLNVGLLNTTGVLNFSARDGRFNEVESGGGGLRILSLMNFSKIAKRISLDFSDVVGEGMSFEKIDARVSLDQGELIFPERMQVDSSAGKFQIGGRVDLRSGALDNDLIVTLPVSKSLPWYALYLGLANPIAGIGVIVGERVLRKPIEQFSTAKYAVTGSLDDPKVDFVSLWDQSIKKTKPRSTPAVEPPNESPPDAEGVKLGQSEHAGDPDLVESEP